MPLSKNVKIGLGVGAGVLLIGGAITTAIYFSNKAKKESGAGGAGTGGGAKPPVVMHKGGMNNPKVGSPRGGMNPSSGTGTLLNHVLQPRDTQTGEDISQQQADSLAARIYSLLRVAKPNGILIKSLRQAMTDGGYNYGELNGRGLAIKM